MENLNKNATVVETIDVTQIVEKVNKSIANYLQSKKLIKDEDMTGETVIYLITDICHYSICSSYSVQCIATDIKAEVHNYIEELALGISDFYKDDIPSELIEMLNLENNVEDTFYYLVYDLLDVFTEVYNYVAENVKFYSTSNNTEITATDDSINLVITNNISNINTYTNTQLGENLGNIPVFRYELDTAYYIFKEITGRDKPIEFKKIIEYSSYVLNCRPAGDDYDIMPEEIKEYLDFDMQVYLLEILKIVNGLPKTTIKNFYGWIGETLSIRSIKNVEYS